MDNLVIGVDNKLAAREVVALRQASGWDADLDEWDKCLKHNLANITARDSTGKLIGAGFLTGNARHAEVTDLVVLPEYREHHVGSSILEEIIKAAKNMQIKYLSLTYDKNFPWLKEFYEKHGFQSIDFAMWHKDSLK